MPAYVTLPGTSGNYFSTPDVNLLDADTAHFQQDKDGSWDTNGGSTALSTDVTPHFGDFVRKFTCSGVTTQVTRTPAGTSGAPVSGSTEYTFSVYMQTAENIEALIGLRWYDSGGGSLTTDTSSALAIPSALGQISHTATSHASAAYCRIQLTVQEVGGGNPTNGDVFYMDAACLRAGSDGSFVPSLRIVGDLDIEAKVALDDYTPAATNTILDCLNSNDGYRLRHTTGDLIEIAYGNGSSTRVQTSSATGLTDGNDHVFKVTVDQSTGAVVYYIDGVQHDTDTMTTGAGSPNINDLVVGANAAASANWTDGDDYYVIVRDGIDGPIVAKFDADDWVGV